jgi:hypothetical protein
LRELAFLVIGPGGHGYDMADATEKTDLYAEWIVTGEVIEMKVEKQNIGSVCGSHAQRVFQCTCDPYEMNGSLVAEQLHDKFADGGAVVGDQNADRRFWELTHVRSPNRKIRVGGRRDLKLELRISKMF